MLREELGKRLTQLDRDFFDASESQQLQMIGQRRKALDVLLYVLWSRKLDPGAVYPRVLEWKGAVFARQERLRRAWSNPDFATLVAERRRITRLLATLASDHPERPRAPGLGVQIEGLSELSGHAAGAGPAGPGPGPEAQIEGLLKRWDEIEVELSRQVSGAAGGQRASPAAPDPMPVTSKLDASSDDFELTEKDIEEELARRTSEEEGRRAAVAAMSGRSVEEGSRETPAAIPPLASVLPSHSALVDALEYTVEMRTQDPLSYWSGEIQTVRQRRIAAFVLRPGQAVGFVDLGPAQYIESDIEQWLALLTGEAPEPVVGNPSERLRRRLLDPLRPYLGGVELLLISPDGGLAQLAWGALPGDRPGSYLIEEMAVAVVPAPRDLPRLLAEPPPTARPSALLAGDIDHGPVPDAGARGATSLVFNPLDSTGPEVLALVRSAGRATPPLEAITRMRGEASKTVFLTEAVGRRYLHLATHGFFRATDPVARTGVPGRTLLDDYPGLRCGLAFAGSNRTGIPPPGDVPVENGILTALEVADHDFRSADLVVLSACETGLGRTVGGEGVLGLQRAFQLAGARTVVASLWKVDDEATRELMEAFYDNLWSRKLGKLDALRRAQLAMIRATGRRAEGQRGVGGMRTGSAALSPYYWASFVLSGDWR